MIRRPPRSTLDRSSAASDVYKRQAHVVALRHRYVRGAELVLVLQAAELDAEQLRERELRRHVGEFFLRELIASDRLREHDAVLAVLERLVHARHPRAQNPPRDAVARLGETHERRLETVGLGETIGL